MAISRITGIALWIVTFIGLIYLSKPLFGNEYFIGHDTEAHVTRSQAYIAAIKEGQFPVRYIGWAFDGAGSPLFNHYPIGFYLSVALLYFIGFPFHTAFYGVVFLSWLFTGIGMAFLMKRYGNLAAWVAAMMWWCAPYAAMEIYLRAAYPELLALCWGVWLLYALYQWFHTRHVLFLWLIACFAAALLITHLPTVLLFLPIFFGLFLRHFHLQYSPKLILAGLLALGLAAFYLMPSLLELKNIQNEELHSGFYDYQWHFLSPWQLFRGTWRYGYDNPGDNDDVSFYFVAGQWQLIVIGFGVGIAAWINRKYPIQSKRIVVWLGATLAYLFISLTISKPLWDHLPLVSFIQFPWRSHAIATICLAITGGLITSLHKKELTILMLACVIGSMYQTHIWFQPFDYLDVPIYSTRDFIVQIPPYPQIGIETAYTPPGSNVDKTTDLPLWSASTSVIIHQLKTTSINLSAQIETTIPASITIKRWSSPGWISYVDGIVVPITKNVYGLLRINIPPGNHQIKVIYQGTPLQHLSNSITLFSLFILGAWIGKSVFRRYRFNQSKT